MYVWNVRQETVYDQMFLKYATKGLVDLVQLLNYDEIDFLEDTVKFVDFAGNTTFNLDKGIPFTHTIEDPSVLMYACTTRVVIIIILSMLIIFR